MESEETLETPLQAAAREEAEGGRKREQREAVAALADISDYMATTSPDELAQAQAQLESWEIPGDPLEEIEYVPDGKPYVAVFSARTEAEAQIIKGVLHGARIPAAIENHSGTSAYGGAFISGEINWGAVLVPEAFAAAARAEIAIAAAADEDDAED
jgi:hypothetical protein